MSADNPFGLATAAAPAMDPALAEAVRLVEGFNPATDTTDYEQKRLSLMRNVGSLMKRYDVQVQELL